MRKVFFMLSLMAVMIVLVGCRNAKAEEVTFKPIHEKETNKVERKIKKALRNHQGEPWMVKMKGLKSSNVGNVDDVIDSLRVDGEYWAVYYKYYTNAKDKEVYNLMLINCSYTTEEGDTWKTVAEDYDIKVKKLKKLNPFIFNEKLQEGMKVTVIDPYSI